MELAAAGLLVGKLDFVPEPLEHVHDGLRRLRKERVAEAGDEEADSQELYRGERDAAVDLDDVKTASGDDRRGDAQGRLRDAVRPSLDERDQRMAGVGGREGVGAGRRACDRDTETAVRVAPLPRIGEGGRRLVPAAVGDLESLALPGYACDGRLHR